MAERQQQRGPAATRPAAWELEFEDAWEADDQRARLVADMADYFASPAGWAELVAGVAPWHGRTVVDLDWQALCATCPCPDLQPAVAAAPVVALSCISCAAYEVRRVLRWRCGVQLGAARWPPGTRQLVWICDEHPPPPSIRAHKRSDLQHIRNVVRPCT